MKKILMGFAACALIMTSCQKSDVIENITDGQGQLSFGVGTQQQGTRAAELNNTTLQDNEITLYAYQFSGATPAWNKWYNDVVEYSGGKWALAKSVRFRNTAATKYITYSSKGARALVVKMDATETTKTTFETANFTTGKYPAFTYTVGDNSATQEDLIAGITEVDENKTDITLGMRHILSQVNFGTVGYKGAKIQIQNIKIAGVKNVGDFTYNGANTYPIGTWTPTTEITDYDYYNWTNAAGTTDNTHTLVPATATSGDKYIFGDGGNWGPGKAATTWYPVGTSGAWEKYNTSTPQTGLKNSLMLLPQTLGTTAKVTFEYKIQDVDGGYVAGNASTWAQGEFSLNFSTGTTTGSHYNSKWEQNYRYVYLIDFTDFLNGVALTFKVDVETYSWENYNNGTNDDGIVNIMAAGQPSQANMNATTFKVGKTWYIASQSLTAPTAADWAQVMRNEIWDLSAYDFANIDATGTFDFNFQNVIFNKDPKTPNNPRSETTITMKLPAGYTAALKAGSTAANLKIDDINAPTYVISAGDGSDKAAITITNNSVYNNTTTLESKITAITADATTIYYKGTAAVDMTTMNNAQAGFAIRNTIVVKFTSSVIPNVGATANGLWTWNAATKTATWTKN